MTLLFQSTTHSQDVLDSPRWKEKEIQEQAFAQLEAPFEKMVTHLFY